MIGNGANAGMGYYPYYLDPFGIGYQVIHQKSYITTRRNEMSEGLRCDACGQAIPKPKTCPTCGQEVKKRKGHWDGMHLCVMEDGEWIYLASIYLYISLTKGTATVWMYGVKTADPHRGNGFLNWNIKERVAYSEVPLDDLPATIREAQRWAEEYFGVEVER